MSKKVMNMVELTPENIEEMTPQFTKEECEALRAHGTYVSTKSGRKGVYNDILDDVEANIETKLKKDERLGIPVEPLEGGEKNVLDVEVIHKNVGCNSRAIFYQEHLGGRHSYQGGGFDSQEEYDKSEHKRPDHILVITDYEPPKGGSIMSKVELQYVTCDGREVFRWTEYSWLQALYLHKIRNFTFKEIAKATGRKPENVRWKFRYMKQKEQDELPRVPKRRKFSPGEIKMMEKFLKDGMPISEIAKTVGRTYGSVHAKLKGLGLI